MAKIIIANWKMNPGSLRDSELILKGISTYIKNIKNIKVVICPPFPFLFAFKKLKSNKIFLGAQNVSSMTEGSHTGEVSPRMLIDVGVKYVIVGHGERRANGEDNNFINKKILNLLKFKLLPIICVGESSRDNEGFYLSFVRDQIKDCLKDVPKAQVKNIIIAYEPIWAIGKDATRGATKEEFIEMKIFIRKIISDIYDSKTAHSIAVLYGGSVNKDNAFYFANEGEADGLLVGRDSINPKKFGAILSALK
jgi:triosephosphate isomerase (TIM)